MYPVSQAAYKKKSARINCFSHSKTHWTKDGLLLGPNAITIQSTLVVNDLKFEDSGVYMCHGSHADGKTFEVSSELYVGGKNYE